MLQALLICGLLLTGGISNQYGRIGVRMSSTGTISHVYDHSPARDAGLQEQDRIIEADGHRGGIFSTVGYWVDGDAGTKVHLKVKRGSFVFEVDVLRVVPSMVHDSDWDEDWADNVEGA
jgi:predicted metalloprotease with PDZ domain